MHIAVNCFDSVMIWILRKWNELKVKGKVDEKPVLVSQLSLANSAPT